MGIAEQFRVAVGRLEEPDNDAGPMLLPTRLSKACVEVLPVVGAGLSLFSAPTMRIPVGASDDTADAAERLQFTFAQGPCFQAHHTGQPVVAPADLIAEEWPLFHDELITHTAVRGIVSMPLPDGLSGVGVLDLYCRRPDDLARIDLGDVRVIAEQIATTLLAEDMFPTFRDSPLWEGPLWLNNPSVTARGYVLLAMGIISVALNLNLENSLAALRAHAFAAGRTLDRVAHDIVNRDLRTADLAPNTNS